MLKPILIALSLLFALAAAPASASEPVSVATADVNLRAGPGTQYPIVTTIPYGSSVSLYGCTAGVTWCDVGWAGERGWVAATYLQAVYAGTPVVVNAVVAPRLGIRVVAFNHAYWVRHYSTFPWYRRWSIYVSP